MSVLDPKGRAKAGRERQAAVLGAAPAEAATPLEAAGRDYVFAEVWTRPELDPRSRFWITIASAACGGETSEGLDGYVRGALKAGLVTLAELREAALHLATYAGWPRGGALDRSASRVAAELGLGPEPTPAIREAAWTRADRLDAGAAAFARVMTFPGPPPITPAYEAGILNFVFGEMWTRPGLDQRSRRWITLVGVSESSSDIPIQSHVYAAMASGDATMDEMHEFVLQFAVNAGWPKASVIQGAVLAQGQRVARGEPFQ